MHTVSESKAERAFQFIDNAAQKYTDFLAQICSFEARAHDKETIDQMVDFISSFAVPNRREFHSSIIMSTSSFGSHASLENT